MDILRDMRHTIEKPRNLNEKEKETYVQNPVIKYEKHRPAITPSVNIKKNMITTRRNVACTLKNTITRINNMRQKISKLYRKH